MNLLKKYEFNLSEKIVNEIINICNNYSSIKKVVLFGSRARGDNHGRSDIDLAIYFEGKSDSHFLYDLSEIETLLKIDLTVINDNLDEKFLNNVKLEGITIWENTKIN